MIKKRQAESMWRNKVLPGFIGSFLMFVICTGYQEFQNSTKSSTQTVVHFQKIDSHLESIDAAQASTNKKLDELQAGQAEERESRIRIEAKLDNVICTPRDRKK